VITIFAIIAFFAQLIFVFNFFYSIFYGRKVTEKNPWKSTTLEWSTEIKPGHGNWGDKLPTVHRWPYDYNIDNVEFKPQYLPVKEGEEVIH